MRAPICPCGPQVLRCVNRSYDLEACAKVSVKIAPWPELFRTPTAPRCPSMIFYDGETQAHAGSFATPAPPKKLVDERLE